MKKLQVLSVELFDGNLKDAFRKAYEVLHKENHWRRWSATVAADLRMKAVFVQMDRAVQSGHMGIRV